MIQPPPGSFILPRVTPRVLDDEASRLVRFLIWGATASVTLGLHVGLYLFLTRTGTPPEPTPQMPAAVMINLSPIAVSAKSEVDNASETPPTAESQKVETIEAEEPPPPAPELIPDAPPPPPDVVSQAVLAPKPLEPPKKKVEKPPEKPIKKPVEKKDKPKKPEEKPRVASKSGGGPKSDRQTADVTAASAAGSAVSEASRASWQNEVRSKIVRAKRFPSDACGQSGVAVISVTFGANGGASGVRLVRSSGNASLDAEAVAVMYRAAPYPSPPGGKTTVLTVPLNFRQ
ncbi:energy transducer TonB [Methylobacterium sp. W2]|uniref:TonB family protein n=1 Tax=Methylobacterium sp. W2 TaxID=2598107 RepID=UPI001D0CBEBC|nr:TonB family protein [Methylobacterium sp. W2]MCC0808481.1 energy transducer TonB [Methylobacterium sp. W2]